MHAGNRQIRSPGIRLTVFGPIAVAERVALPAEIDIVPETGYEL